MILEPTQTGGVNQLTDDEEHVQEFRREWGSVIAAKLRTAVEETAE